MVTLIQQRTAHDCGICCLAMLTGRSYEEIIEAIGDVFDAERGMKHPSEALKRLGFSYTFSNGTPSGDICHRHRGPLAPEYFRGFAWGRRALLAVPSLNYPGSQHMVYYDGFHVHDPSPLTIYREFHDLMPEEITLFRENKP